MRKVNKDPFSKGTEFMMFEDACCNKCIKASQPRDGGDGLVYYTNERDDGLPKCSIQRDNVIRMFTNKPINERTIQICHDFIMKGTLCPYRKTYRKTTSKKRAKTDKNQLRFEL